MRSICRLSAVVAAIWWWAWCAWSADKLPSCKPNNNVQVSKPSVDRSKFADYKSWKAVNGEPVYQPGRRAELCEPAGRLVDPHEGGFISIYVNDLGRKNYASAKPAAFAEGTVIVKEKLHRKDADKPDELGIMVKREQGYDAEAGDWQFLFVDDKQELTTVRTKLTTCIECHKKQAASDYVFGLPKPGANTNRSY